MDRWWMDGCGCYGKQEGGPGSAGRACGLVDVKGSACRARVDEIRVAGQYMHTRALFCLLYLVSDSRINDGLPTDYGMCQWMRYTGLGIREWISSRLGTTT